MVTKNECCAKFPSRRRLLQALTVAAAQTTVACRQTSDEARLSVEALRGASVMHGRSLSDERLEVIRPELERQLTQLEAVRNFDLEESVEPATLFLAKRY